MKRLLPLLLLVGCPADPDDSGDTDDTDDTDVEAQGCGDAVCDAGEGIADCPYDCGFPYLVLVDQGSTEGGSPGVDLDAVSVTRDGTVHWASAVGGSLIGGPENEWTDTSEALGASDSECIGQNFVALGGLGSWIALSFGPDFGPRPGDTITVYELSADMCDNDMRNDSWEALLATAPEPSGEYLVRGSGLGEFEVPAF